MKKVLIVFVTALFLMTSFSFLGDVTSKEEPKGTRDTVSVDETWDISGSPYYFNENVYVDEGVTLTIDPGVEVIFQGYHRFYVGGTLIVNGDQSDPVLFSYSSSPYYARWLGIYVNSTGQVHMDHAQIEYAYYGVYFDSSRGGMINDTYFFYCRQGIRLNWAVGTHIENCTFTRTQWDSIYAYYAYYTYLNNSNFVNEPGWNTQNPQIERCHNSIIWNNYFYDTYDEFYFYYCDYITVYNNVMDNVRDGMRFYRNRWSTYVDNSVSGSNLNWKFYIDGGSGFDYYDHIVSGNTINGRDIIYVKDQTGLLFNSADYSSIYLIRSNNIVIRDTSLLNIDRLYGYLCDNILIDNVLIDESRYPVYFYQCDYVTINNSEISNINDWGLNVYQTDHFTVMTTDLHDCTNGLYLQYSEFGHFEGFTMNNIGNYEMNFYGGNIDEHDHRFINCFSEGLPMMEVRDEQDLVYDGLSVALMVIFNSINITVKNIDFRDHMGMWMVNSPNCNIINNDFRTLYSRIMLYEVHNSKIIGNLFSNTGYNWALYLDDCDNNVIADNHFTRYNNAYGYGLYIDWSDNNLIHGNQFSTYYGNCYMDYSDNCEFYDNTARNGDYGLQSYSCDNLKVYSNEFIDNRNYGYYMNVNHNNLDVYENIFRSNQNYGIYLVNMYSSSTTNIFDNTFFGNQSQYDRGVRFQSNNYNVMFKRNLLRDFDEGLWIPNSLYNSEIHHNGFINCVDNVLDETSTKISFDDGKLGNYYANYHDIDADNDRIWDNPYIISATSRDNYPSVGLLPDRNAPIIQMIYPTTGYINNMGEIKFNIIDSTLQNVTYSFDSGPRVPFYPPYSISTFGLADNVYAISVKADDRYARSTEESFIVKVDSTPPDISLFSPTSPTITPGTPVVFQVDDVNIDRVEYSINDDGPFLLEIPYIIPTDEWVIGTTYRITATAYDLAQNAKDLTVLIKVIDNNPPEIELVSPPVGTLLGQHDSVRFNIKDGALRNVTTTIQGRTFELIHPYTIPATSLPQGDVTISILAVDEYGNKGTKEVKFKVDTLPPEIVLNTPSEGSTVRTGAEIDLDITDNNLESVQYSVNGKTKLLADPYDLSLPDAKDGKLSLEVTATDKAGGSRTSVFEFIADNTAPRVLTSSIANNSEISTGLIQLTFSENMNKASVGTALDLGSATPDLLWSGSTLFITFDPAPGASYVLEISDGAKDLAGNPLIPFVLHFSSANEGAVGTDDDRDDDAMLDAWEKKNGLDPTIDDSGLDDDGDGLTNLQEFQLGTDPRSKDSDGDGMPDHWEYEQGLDPTDALDGTNDRDGDGFSNSEEYLAGTDIDNSKDHPAKKESGLNISWMPIIFAIIVILIFVVLLILFMLKGTRPERPDYLPADVLERIDPQPVVEEPVVDEEPELEPPEEDVPPPPEDEPGMEEPEVVVEALEAEVAETDIFEEKKLAGAKKEKLPPDDVELLQAKNPKPKKGKKTKPIKEDQPGVPDLGWDMKEPDGPKKIQLELPSMEEVLKESDDPYAVNIPEEIVKPILALPPATTFEDEDENLPKIDEVFVMTKGGILLMHFSNKQTTLVDKDILSSMITVLQNFIADSFQQEGSALRELRLGDFNIVLSGGEFLSVVILSPEEDLKSLQKPSEKMIEEMEELNADVLEDFSGNADDLTQVDALVKKLLKGEYS